MARWDYYLARNAFYIDAAEFFPRGYSVSLWTGLQLDEVYEKRVVLDVTVNYGIHFKKFGYLYPQFNFKGYVRHKKGEEMVTTVSLDYVSNRVALSKIVYFRQLLQLIISHASKHIRFSIGSFSLHSHFLYKYRN